MSGLPKGSRCPLESELADKCGVSRTTVRKAYKLLEDRGVIYRHDSIRLLGKKIDSDITWKKSAPLSKEKEVAEYLVGLIGEGKLIQGQRLNEKKIAESLGCSISPVREALISLAPLGLFEKKSRHQWQVVNPDNEQFEELYEYRSIIEIYCLKKLMEKKTLAENLPRLKSLLQRTEKLLCQKTIDFKVFFEIDVLFHHFLLKVPNNRFIIEKSRFIYTIIDFQRSSRYYTVKRARLALSQHIGILKAIIASDETAALQELNTHLFSALETLKSINKSELT